MSDIQRKKHTGEPGNGGQFGAKTNAEADVDLTTSAPVIDEDRFEDEYKPQVNADGDDTWSRGQIEDVPFNRVWSLVDADDGNIYAEAGVRYVNSIGSYVVTEKPWDDPQASAVWAALDDDE